MAENTTQFMTSVMQKLRTANQVSQSNNLSTIVTNQQADNKPKPKQANPNGSYQVENHKTLSGKATTNNHSDYKFWDDLLSVNGGQGFIQDETARNIVKGILTPFGTIEDVANEVAYGVTKVGESLVDGLVGLFGWIGSWFGADDQWAKDFIAYDASRWCVENLNLNLMDGFSQLALGESLAEQSVINELPEGWQDGIRGASNIVGEIIPSVVLAIFTGGSSLGVQVAAQAALAGVSAYGQSVESGVQSGAELGESIGYGAIKGGVSAVLAGVTHGVGGAITSKTGSSVGGKIMDKVIDKGGSMTTALVAQAGFKVTTSAGRAALQTAVDPLIRQITIDGEAIEKAYGSEEAVKNTLGNIGKNAAMAAIITLGTTAVQTGVEVHKAGGMEQYTQNYLDAKVFRDAGLGKEYNRVNAYNKSIEKLDAQLQNGEISKDQWLASTRALNEQFNSDINKLQDVYREVSEKGISAKDYSTSKYSEQYKTAMENGQNLMDMAVDRQKVPAFIDVARQTGKSDTEIFNKLVREGVIKGSVDITNENGQTTFTTKDNLKLTFKSGDNHIDPANTREVTALIGIVGNTNNVGQIPNSMTLPNVMTPKIGGNDQYHIDIKVLRDTLQKSDYTPKQVTTMLKTLPRANMISEVKDGKFSLVSKTYDNDGKAQYNVFQIANEDHSIKSMTIADKVPDDVFTLKLDENGEPIGIPSHIVKNSADMTMPTRQPLSSSTNVVKRFKNEINDMIKTALGEKTNYKVDIGSTKKIGRYLFEKVNDEKVGMKVAGEIADTLTNFSITDDNGNHIDFKELYEISGKSLDDYKTSLTNDIVDALKKSAKETKISKIQKVFDRNMETIKTLVEKNRESIKAGGRMNVFVNTRNKARTTTRMDLKWTNDNIRYNTMSLMIKPLTNIHTSGDKMSTKGFWENIEEWKASYTPDNELLKVENNPRLPYNERFRDEMLLLEALMPKQNPNGTYPSMNSLALAQATRVIRMAQHLNDRARKYDIDTNPKGRAIAKGVSRNVKTRKDGTIRNLIKKINEVEAYELENNTTYLHQAFENNPTINDLVDNSAISYLEAQDYRMDRTSALNRYEKQIGIKVSKKISVNKDVELTIDEAVDIYNLLNTYGDEVTRVSKIVLENDNKKTNIISKITLKELEDFIKDNLPDNAKDYGDHIKGLYNNEEKPNYNERFIEENGIESNAEDDYYPTSRLGESEKGAKNRMYTVPNFGNKYSKVKNNNAFVIVGAKKRYLNYVKGMGLYTKADAPYDNFLKTINTKVNVNGEETTVKSYLINNYGKKSYDRLVKFMEQNAGLIPDGEKEPTLLDRTLDKLTNLRIMGTLSSPFVSLKQPASLFTSNIRSTSILKGIGERINSREADIEYGWMEKNLPGLKNRSMSNAAILGNMAGDDPFNKYTQWIDKYTMFLTRGADKLTIKTLAKTLPYQVQLDFGHKVGSEANREIVKQLWIDTILKQIGNDPSHHSTLSQSHGWTRLFFGNYQGAINAFFSGFKDKCYSFIAYHKADEATINARVDETKTIAEEAKSQLDEARTRLDKAMEEGIEEEVKDAEQDYEEKLNDFQEKQSDYEDAKNDQKGYRKYKSYSGGKSTKFFIHTATGVALMGLTLGLVDQIKKWFTGKEKPSDFEIGTFMTSVLTSATISQIPVFNTLYGVVANNYDLTNPGASLLTDALDLVKGIKSSIESGDWSKLLRNSGWFIANMTGMPLKTAYEIVDGVVGWFDPETAIKMNNVLYGVSTNTAMKNFHSAAQSGNEGEATAYLKVAMEDKVGSTTDKVAQELYRLYQKGENSVPKASMTSYTNEKGEEVTLTDLQKTNFRNTYSKANNLVDKLIKNSYYTSLSDEQKGNAISYVYNAYYDYAKGNVTNAYSSKMGYVLGKTKGNVDTNTVATSISYIKGLEATKKSTRKELAIKYVNSLKCEKGLKYLILKLAGYGLDDKAKSTLKRYLTKQGMSGKDAKEFVE